MSDPQSGGRPTLGRQLARFPGKWLPDKCFRYIAAVQCTLLILLCFQDTTTLLLARDRHPVTNKRICCCYLTKNSRLQFLKQKDVCHHGYFKLLRRCEGKKCNLHQLFHFVWQQVKKTGSIFYLLDGQISNRDGCPPEFPWFIKQSAYALPSVENMQVAYFSSLNFPFKLPLCLSICVFWLNHHIVPIKKSWKCKLLLLEFRVWHTRQKFQGDLSPHVSWFYCNFACGVTTWRDTYAK